MKPNVKKVLEKVIRDIDKKYALLLSSGVDSRSIFFESIEQGKEFECYTFRLDGVMSTDFIEARSLCEEYGVKHNEVILPNSIGILKQDLITLKKLGANKKTEFECFWAFLYTYKAIKEDVVISGLGADGHFCISKKAMIHYKDKPDEYRKLLFDDPSYCQMLLHEKYNEGKEHIVPFLSSEMIQEFMGSTWDEVNRPREKYSIVEPYLSYFDKVKLHRHANYQLGDSGIAKHFGRLLDTELNTGDFKSVVSIYNRVVTNQLQLEL